MKTTTTETMPEVLALYAPTMQTSSLRDRYRRAAARLRVNDVVTRHLHVVFGTRGPCKLGHARWLLREVRAAKAIRDQERN